ncbi:hypothetical protein [Moraxella oblonga]|uniref:hypothetical protein n=1 Tax=Moraxella oblonga TaxID=200413 RepID=UPI00082ABDE0|nr:hypothetical protein [Moraxella oblonga]
MPISLFEQHYQALQHLDNGIKIQLIEQLQKDVYQQPLNDLSKLTAHTDFVNGNSDDFVSMNWEKELNLDFPQ